MGDTLVIFSIIFPIFLLLALFVMKWKPKPAQTKATTVTPATNANSPTIPDPTYLQSIASHSGTENSYEMSVMDSVLKPRTKSQFTTNAPPKVLRRM